MLHLMFGSSFDILYESLPFYFHQFKTSFSWFQVFSVSCESGAYRLNGAPPARTGAKLNESFKKNCVFNRSNLNHQFDAMSKNPSLQSLPLLNMHRISFDYKTIHCYFLRSKRGHSGSKQKRAKTTKPFQPSTCSQEEGSGEITTESTYARVGRRK